MSIGLLGRKLGMTQVYDEFGRCTAVTAIEAGPCTITAIRTVEKDRYHALQVGFETSKADRLTKPRANQTKSIGDKPFNVLREFRLSDEGDWEVGKQITVDLFNENEIVDVSGTSLGKGFQGGMARWGWSGGPESHGSMSHRRPGSVGAGTSPGRVLKGHHTPGRMGNERVTVQNVRIVRKDQENNLLLIAGAVPGAKNSLVEIRKSAKKPEAIKKISSLFNASDEEEGKPKGGHKSKKAKK